MMRRLLSGFSLARSDERLRHITQRHLPFFLSSRKEFSINSDKKASKVSSTSSTSKSSDSSNYVSKVITVGVALGTIGAIAYQTLYVDHVHNKKEQEGVLEHEEPHSSSESENIAISNNNVDSRDKQTQPDYAEANSVNVNATNNDKMVDFQSGPLDSTELSRETKSEDHDTEKMESGSGESILPSNGDESLAFASHDQPKFSQEIPKDISDKINSENVYAQLDTSMEPKEEIDHGGTEVDGMTKDTRHEFFWEPSEDVQNNNTEKPRSLLDTYLIATDEGDFGTSKDVVNDDNIHFSQGKEASTNKLNNLKNAKETTDEELVLDFIQAIHVAERNQAESDARKYSEEKRILKEKYEKELKDTRAREFMFAEEAALLDKELIKEKEKAAAAIKSTQEEAEKKLKIELQRKEEEAKLHLKEAQELAKAKLAAAIANEKSVQLEKMKEANLHIKALCMAFYARSEEARQSHSVHRIALGALALEEALSKGMPIEAEVSTLNTYIEGIDRDSLLGLVLASLPEETLSYGTITQMQLNQKFDDLKGMLRHFSLIPVGGGGILTHAVASITSSLKMREDDKSGDGIESIINQVQSFLSEGRLVEAADALELGVQGSQAEAIITEWVRETRNRAIVDQALSFLHSYAISMSLT